MCSQDARESPYLRRVILVVWSMGRWARIDGMTTHRTRGLSKHSKIGGRCTENEKEKEGVYRRPLCSLSQSERGR